MSLRDQIAEAISQSFSQEFLGKELLYNGVEVDAIFTPLIDPKNQRGGSASTATLQVQVSQVASWAVDDLVSRNGELWRVKREGPGGTWYKHVLQIERDRRVKP